MKINLFLIEMIYLLIFYIIFCYITFQFLFVISFNNLDNILTNHVMKLIVLWDKKNMNRKIVSHAINFSYDKFIIYFYKIEDKIFFIITIIYTKY